MEPYVLVNDGTKNPWIFNEKPIKVFVSAEGHSPVIMVPSDAEVKRKDGLDDDPIYGGITY